MEFLAYLHRRRQRRRRVLQTQLMWLKHSIFSLLIREKPQDTWPGTSKSRFDLIRDICSRHFQNLHCSKADTDAGETSFSRRGASLFETYEGDGSEETTPYSGYAMLAQTQSLSHGVEVIYIIREIALNDGQFFQ